MGIVNFTANWRPLADRLTQFGSDLRDWRPFWRDRALPLLYRELAADFERQGAESGSPWAALSPEYAAWKQRRYPGRGILVREGALKSSLSGPNAAAAIVRATTTAIEVGTSIPYAAFHQNPGSGSRLPQRPPMRLSAAARSQLGESLQLHVRASWGRRRANLIEGN